jgi:general secretion pathway protein M
VALAPQQSRRLALGLLALLVMATIAALVVPVTLAHRHYDSALASMTDTLERYRRIAATRPDVVRNLEAIRAQDSRKFYLRSGSSALAAAEVQEMIRGLIESSGGRLITMQAPAAKDEGRYRQITVNVQMTANIVALRRVLHAVESGTPYLFVDNLMVRSQVPSNFKPAPNAEPEMFVQFDVHGYALTGT